MKIENAIGTNETIYWKSKQDRKCFVLESIFNPMLPIAIVWLLFDSFFIGQVFGGGAFGRTGFFMIPFFLLHLMPVWIYFGGIIMMGLRYRNTEYAITNVGVYVSGGVFSHKIEMKPFAKINNIEMHTGIFDRICGTGDVVFHIGSYRDSDGDIQRIDFGIYNISDYEEVYKMLKKMQADIYSDTMYPNDLRPETNHGYNTKYVPEDED